MNKAGFDHPRGFTLIELMIVVAIIGILATIAIPKFADLVRKSKEGAAKGNLGAMRSALEIYYSDNEGRFPTQNAAQFGPLKPKYLSDLSDVGPPDYHALNWSTDWVDDPNGPLPVDFSSDTGGWLYLTTGAGNVASGNSPSSANIYVNCTHTDTKGTVWTNY